MTFFSRISSRSAPLQRQYTSSLYSLQNTHFSPTLCAPLAQGSQLLRFEFGLQLPVKFYPGLLRFGGVTREKPILSSPACMLCKCMTAYRPTISYLSNVINDHSKEDAKNTAKSRVYAYIYSLFSTVKSGLYVRVWR